LNGCSAAAPAADRHGGTSSMSPPPVRQWQARLDIHLNRQGARTVLAAHRHSGPLRLQRPFYPEGSAVCHLCLLHPPGGLVMGDELSTTLTLEAAAEAVVTTPSAGKFYGVGDGPAQRQCIELGVLLAGHAKNAYWYGSRLTIGQARSLCPLNNATSLQRRPRED